MKKFYCILLFFFAFADFTFSQNIIPNGDFEIGSDSTSIGWCCGIDSNCSPTNTILGPYFWSVVNGSPDRLIEDDIPSIPPCGWDIDTAYSGKAWIDFVYDEAGKTTLFAPLHKDSIYRLQCYMSLETFQGLSTQPNRIQFNFNNGGSDIVTPYISIPEWQYFDTTFTAMGNSTEMEIRGIEPITGTAVKIDNISLMKNVSTGINNIKNSNRIVLFPNPADDFIYVVLNNENIFNLLLINCIGEKIKTKIIKMSYDCIRIDLSDLPKGIYTVTVQVESEQQIAKNFLKTN